MIARETGTPTAATTPASLPAAGATVADMLKPMVSSLARIGGEAGGLLARTGLALDRERNRTLQLIHASTKRTADCVRRGGTATAAAF